MRKLFGIICIVAIVVSLIIMPIGNATLSSVLVVVALISGIIAVGSGN